MQQVCSHGFSAQWKRRAPTWIYLKALRSTLRLDVFLSSTFGMFLFRVSKHSFKCARLGGGKRGEGGYTTEPAINSTNQARTSTPFNITMFCCGVVNQMSNRQNQSSPKHVTRVTAVFRAALRYLAFSASAYLKTAPPHKQAQTLYRNKVCKNI